MCRRSGGIAIAIQNAESAAVLCPRRLDFVCCLNARGFAMCRRTGGIAIAIQNDESAAADVPAALRFSSCLNARGFNSTLRVTSGSRTPTRAE